MVIIGREMATEETVARFMHVYEQLDVIGKNTVSRQVNICNKFSEMLVKLGIDVSELVAEAELEYAMEVEKMKNEN
jgi:hypothetical protein